MLVLPMPVVWSLHTTIGTKIQLTFTFAVGSLYVLFLQVQKKFQLG